MELLFKKNSHIFLKERNRRDVLGRKSRTLHFLTLWIWFDND